MRSNVVVYDNVQAIISWCCLAAPFLVECEVQGSCSSTTGMETRSATDVWNKCSPALGKACRKTQVRGDDPVYTACVRAGVFELDSKGQQIYIYIYI